MGKNRTALGIFVLLFSFFVCFFCFDIGRYYQHRLDKEIINNSSNSRRLVESSQQCYVLDQVIIQDIPIQPRPLPLISNKTDSETEL